MTRVTSLVGHTGRDAMKRWYLIIGAGSRAEFTTNSAHVYMGVFTHSVLLNIGEGKTLVSAWCPDGLTEAGGQGRQYRIKPTTESSAPLDGSRSRGRSQGSTRTGGPVHDRAVLVKTGRRRVPPTGALMSMPPGNRCKTAQMRRVLLEFTQAPGPRGRAWRLPESKQEPLRPVH